MTQGAKGPSVQGLQAVLDLAAGFPEWEKALVARAVAALPREQVVVSKPVVDLGSMDQPEDLSVADEVTAEDTLKDPEIDLPPAPVHAGNGQTIRFVTPPGR